MSGRLEPRWSFERRHEDFAEIASPVRLGVRQEITAVKRRSGIVYEGYDGTRAGVAEPVIRGLMYDAVMPGSLYLGGDMAVGFFEGM